jgi:hypothetical protein
MKERERKDVERSVEVDADKAQVGEIVERTSVEVEAESDREEESEAGGS